MSEDNKESNENVPNREIVARCINCNHSFTEPEIEGATKCPNCSSTAVPLDPMDDVTIKINTHELRVLGIWAENYARRIDNQKKTAGETAHQPLAPTVDKIAQRLEAQLSPEQWVPLTLTRELRDLQENYPTSQIIVFEDGEEKTPDQM